MAKVNICDVTVLDNPSPFKNPFQFEITFECLEDLKDGKIFTNWLIIVTWDGYIDRTLIDAWIVYQEGIYHDQLLTSVILHMVFTNMHAAVITLLPL